MIPLRVESADEKHVRLAGLDPVIVHCLHELPQILPQREQPGVRERLYPDPTNTEAEFNDEWRQLVGPELHHLFASAEETIGRDLAGLERDDAELLIPVAHLDAWINALNQARLILATRFDIDAPHLQAAYDTLPPIQQQAVLRIDLFGHLLALFVRVVGGPPEE
ncbi:DUF2017 family protein [bacterium]|nr:DUF2017 family protein [bacterium]